MTTLTTQPQYYAIVSKGYRGKVRPTIAKAVNAYLGRHFKLFRFPPPYKGWVVAGTNPRALSLATPWSLHNAIVPGIGSWWSVKPCRVCHNVIDDYGPYRECHPCRVIIQKQKERLLRLENCRIGRHIFGSSTFIENLSDRFTGQWQRHMHTCQECGISQLVTYPGRYYPS